MKPDTLAQHKTRWQKALEGRMLWTREAWIDKRFEANKAWSPEELEIFRAQGREPSNYAIIRPVVEATCGIEAQTRSDLRFVSHTSQYADTSQALTYLNKSIDHQNQAARHRSLAFRDTAITGVGIMEVAYNPDPLGEQIMKRRENPFDHWFDPTGKEPDLYDHLDHFRAKHLYPQQVALMFPELRGQVPWAALGVGDYDRLSHTADYTNENGDRPPVALFNNAGGGDPNYGPGHGVRMPYWMYGTATQNSELFAKFDRYDGLVRVVERWYRVFDTANFARFRNGLVLENTEENIPTIARALVNGEILCLERKIARRMRCAIFLDEADILLQDVESPYSHGEFPFIPIWAYQDEDGVPMGLVRALRDPAKEFNARRTHLLKRATMRQVLFEEGAFADEDEARFELAKFNGMVRLNPGALAGGRVQIKDNLESSQVDVMLLNGAQQMVQDNSGQNREALGMATNAESGIAIQARQKQATTNLYTLFDNRNWAQVHEGELTLSMIQDTYTYEQEVRVLGDTKGLQYITLNKQDPNGFKVNDVTQGRYYVDTITEPETPDQQAQKAQLLNDYIQAEGDPGLRGLFAPQMAELLNMPSDVVEQVQQYVQQRMQGPPPEPPKPVLAISGKLTDLAPNQRDALLQEEANLPPANQPPADPQALDAAKVAQGNAKLQLEAQGHQLEAVKLAHQHQLDAHKLASDHQHRMAQVQHQAILQAQDHAHKTAQLQAEQIQHAQEMQLARQQQAQQVQLAQQQLAQRQAQQAPQPPQQ